MFDDLPDARDGLTRKERVVLWVLRGAEAERKGRGVRAAMLYGRAVEHVDMSIHEFMRIVERLSRMHHGLLIRSQQRREGERVRILAICGSLQAKSGNSALLRAAQAAAPSGVEVVHYGGLRDLPHFDPDLEAEGVLAVVEMWRAIAESDALLIASPEYGHSLPGVLKNGIDWVIGSGELERKIVAITAAVPGPERGLRGLRALADTLAAVSAVIVGGAPIARGPAFNGEVAALLHALIDRVRA